MEPVQAKNLSQRLRRLANKIKSHDGLSAGLEKALAADLTRMEQRLERPEKPAKPGKEPVENTTGENGTAEEYLIWCDGSCAPNPGPGGWGALIDSAGERRELSGASPQSTNNIMELTAAIKALALTPPGASITLTTDSRYVIDGITRWVEGWKRRGWRKADGKPLLNQEQWLALDSLAGARSIQWWWVRGHSGHPENERCDELANQARREQDQQE